MISSASLILLILVNSVLTLNNCSRPNFDFYRQEYKKDEKMYQNFMFSCPIVNKHNNIDWLPFKLGLNQFATEKFPPYLVSQINIPDTYKHSTDEFNWLQKYPILRSLAIRNQMKCQNCYIMSAVAAFEVWRVVYNNIVVNISVANVQNCLNQACTKPGDVAVALNHLQKSEIVSEDQSPYPSNSENPILKSCIGNGAIAKNNFAFKQLPAPNLSLNEMKQMLKNHGPIVIGIDSRLPTFKLYSQGIFEDVRCTKRQDHSALLIGYGHDSKLKKSFWLIKNSWSEKWGERGFIRVTQDPEKNCLNTNYAFYIAKPDDATGNSNNQASQTSQPPRKSLPPQAFSPPKKSLPPSKSLPPPKSLLPPTRQLSTTYEKPKRVRNRANLAFIYPVLLVLNFGIAYYV